MERKRPNVEQTPRLPLTDPSKAVTLEAPHFTQFDAVKALAALPRRVVSLLWALTAMHATTGASGATYRAIAVMAGIADKKNVRSVVRIMESERLVQVSMSGRLVVVNLTRKATVITNLLLRVIPYEEITFK